MRITEFRFRRVVLAASAVALLCAPATASAATAPEAARLTTDPAPAPGFGGAVASAGDIVVVGDKIAEKVFVYERPDGDWDGDEEPLATLFRPDLPAGSRFGQSVDISADGSLIVVGAPETEGVAGVQTKKGRVYAYKRPPGGWSGNQEPYTADSAPPAERVNYFSDDLLSNAIPAFYDNAMNGLEVVAAPDGSWLGLLENRTYFNGEPQAGGQPAMIALFPLETPHPYAPERRLYLKGPSGSITSLATNDDGTTIFAGVPGYWGNTGLVVAWNDPSGDWLQPGASLFFQPQEGELSVPIVIGTPAYAGASVEASGDWVLAGAPRATVGGAAQAGKAFVWKKPAGGWNKLGPLPTGPEPYDAIMPVATLTASDPVAMDRFGQSSGILDDAIGVAAPGATVGANAVQGKAYVFREPAGGWSGEIDDEVTQFAASDGAVEDRLGWYFPFGDLYESGQGVALTPDALVASAPEHGKPTYVFEFKPQLSVATSGSGTVSGGAIACPGTCEASEWLGDTVTLTATPDPGSTFTGWSGACEGSGPCEVTIDGDQAVTANFASLPPPVDVTLTVTVVGQGSVSGGGIDCPGICGVSKAAGSTVTLTATPAAGSTFTGWSGACAGTGPCELTMDSDEEVSASFAPRPGDGGGGGQQPPGVGPPSLPPGPITQPKKPLKCKKGFVKKKVKGKPRCVKRKQKKKRGGRPAAGRYSSILKPSFSDTW